MYYIWCFIYGVVGQVCNNSPILYYCYGFINATGLPDYAELKVGTPLIDSLQSFMLENVARKYEE